MILNLVNTILDKDFNLSNIKGKNRHFGEKIMRLQHEREMQI